MMQKQIELLKSKGSGLKRLISATLVGLITINAFSPMVFLMTLHLDTHLLECKEHLHLTENEETICILEELMPGSLDIVPTKAVSYFFPKLFLETRASSAAPILNENLAQNLSSHLILLYSSPVLTPHSPPPRLC